MLFSELSCRCCIVGGGPAGMMLGLLFARAGIDVIVLEKHADFLRDFRGDTVHPSTLAVMHELGLLERFLARPHDKARTLTVTIGDAHLQIADFTHVPTPCKFIAMMPQWEFLDFLRDEATRYANFRLIMSSPVQSLIENDGVVVGVKANTPEGTLTVMADTVIAADGRHSVLRANAKLAVRNLGAPIDVLWLRIPVATGDPLSTGLIIGRGQVFVMIHRGTYWQCAYVIPKGGSELLHERGLPDFRKKIIKIAPFLAQRVHAIATWEDIKLLSVRIDRLQRWWKPGLLCIGDAAHAMSPVGGVGINLAIQDAVATANLLTRPLAEPDTDTKALTSLFAKIQKRRMLPTKATQAAQIAIHHRFLVPTIQSNEDRPLKVPRLLALLNRCPLLQALPAYAVGIGIRPEYPTT